MPNEYTSVRESKSGKTGVIIGIQIRKNAMDNIILLPSFRPQNFTIRNAIKANKIVQKPEAIQSKTSVFSSLRLEEYANSSTNRLSPVAVSTAISVNTAMGKTVSKDNVALQDPTINLFMVPSYFVMIKSSMTRISRPVE